MTFKTLDFQCALITGGSGGIGRAIAENFLSRNKRVIICGRTESKLQSASREMGSCPYYVLDTSRTSDIADFISKVTKEHPDLDCLVNNAGVQRPLDVNKMDAEDFLERADDEILTNVNGPLHLAVRLLPHFRKQPGAVIMNVSSVLGYIPTSIINPVYNGTKSFVHFWSMNLRTQLAQSDSNIRVIEIAPPTVSTDLHRERTNPNDNSKDANPSALSLKEFIDDLSRSLEEGQETIGVGPSHKVVDRWNKEFLGDYTAAAKA